MSETDTGNCLLLLAQLLDLFACIHFWNRRTMFCMTLIVVLFQRDLKSWRCFLFCIWIYTCNFVIHQSVCSSCSRDWFKKKKKNVFQWSHQEPKRRSTLIWQLAMAAFDFSMAHIKLAAVVSTGSLFLSCFVLIIFLSCRLMPVWFFWIFFFFVSEHFKS